MTGSASASGQYAIGGELQVTRLGFGTMQLAGNAVWGEPADRDEALRTLRRLPELGVDFIDTADAYGPFITEDLIHEALYPYDGIVVATKVGHLRWAEDDPIPWPAVGRPEYLRSAARMCLRRLGGDAIDLLQLHRVDTKVPMEEQFGALKELQDEGVVRHLGLSNVTVDHIKAASEVFNVATVQNIYNVERRDQEVFDHCEREGIAYVPWFPLNDGNLAKPDGVTAAVAAAHDATPAQVALAWLLQQSPSMLPIPGTSTVAHLEENVAAADLTLTDAELAQLDAEGGPPET
ncbi:MAG TPA: aldo/keto reductase [Conexibacter sp.]|jgi:aryl-alcohol dehydrogenase-like predicted oxidoreductase